MRKTRFGFLGLLALLSCALVSGCNPYRQIPPGSVGVVFDAYSGISKTVLKPGVVFQGINDHVTIYPTSIHNASYVRNSREGERSGDDSVVATTVEGAQLPIDLTVVWHVDPANTVDVFKNFGTENLDEIQSDFIRYIAIYGVNAVSGSKSIFDITSKDRAQFGPEVRKIITPIMTNMGLTCDDVYIGETYPSEDIDTLVKDRISKRNELQIVTNNLQRARIEATTSVNNAKAAADINRLKAQQGDEAVELKKREIVRILISKWNGAPPEIGDGGIPFINPSILKPGQSAPKSK
jgi:regulator of protease activity HflC (stomatin/prohibitin superfamily)